MGDYLRKRINKWISTGKNRGGGYLRKIENNWISTVKTGVGDQPKEKRKLMD